MRSTGSSGSLITDYKIEQLSEHVDWSRRFRPWVTTINICVIGTRFMPPSDALTALSQLVKAISRRHHAALTVWLVVRALPTAFLTFLRVSVGGDCVFGKSNRKRFNRATDDRYFEI